MKYIYCLFVTVFIFSNLWSQDKPDFTYSVKSSLKNSANIGLVLNPVDFDAQIGGSFSGGIILSNLFELVSAEFMFSHYYATH